MIGVGGRLLAVIVPGIDVDTRLRWPYRSVPMAEAERWCCVARAMAPKRFPDS